jgi:sortase A
LFGWISGGEVMAARARSIVGFALQCLGAIAIVWTFWQLADGWLHQRRANRALDAARDARSTSRTAPAPEPASMDSTAVAPAVLEPSRIEIPRIDVSAMIVASDDAVGLRRGVAHIAGTAWFAQTGNVGLAGHRDSYFRNLGRVAIGDTIRITTTRADHRYVVEWKRIVGPEAVDVLDATPEPALTLVTCYPFQYIGPAPERFVVRARGVRPAAQPAAGGAPSGRVEFASLLQAARQSGLAPVRDAAPAH